MGISLGLSESAALFSMGREAEAARLLDRLEEMGIQDGDLVSLYNLDFEYQR